MNNNDFQIIQTSKKGVTSGIKLGYTMNTMHLAWLNAKTAQAWHGKGTKREYLSSSMRLAHKGYNLRTALLIKVAGAGLTSFIIGLGYGSLLATI